MSLPKLTENLNKVSSLAEKPTLTAQQLQAVFDEAGNAIKDYINDVLTTEIEQLITSTVQANKTTVENVLTSTSTTNALSARQGKVLGDRFNYSEAETVIGKWINNKPIYRKVIPITEYPGAGQTYISHNIANIDEIIKYDSYFYNYDEANTHETRKMPSMWFTNIDQYIATAYWVNRTYVQIYLGSWWSEQIFRYAHVIIEYTKTTD